MSAAKENTQTVDITAGLRWLTQKRDEAMRENNAPQQWQQAIFVLQGRSFPAQLSSEELALMPYGIAVHHAHCCADHGCKYAQSDCPVAVLRIVQQAYRCEECFERQKRMDKILQGVEEAAAEAVPGSEFSEEAVVRAFREVFVKGALWAASKGAER